MVLEVVEKSEGSAEAVDLELSETVEPQQQKHQSWATVGQLVRSLEWLVGFQKKLLLEVEVSLHYW